MHHNKKLMMQNKEVDTELNQAKTNVDQSSTNEYVDNAVKEGKAKINAVKTFSEYKRCFS